MHTEIANINRLIGALTCGYTLRDSITEFLGDDAPNFQLDELEEAYREAINAALAPVGVIVSIDGKVWSQGTAPDSEISLREIIEGVDFWAIAQQHVRAGARGR